jgi:hypothetical protein
MDFHRITLERGHSGSRLLIEFSAFRSGVLELPPIEIGGERFAGLHVDIRSILDPGETGAVLSGPVLPLAVPGTAPLVYGTMGAVALLLSLSLWAGTWGRRHLGGWILRWRKRRLIVSMAIVEKRLRRTLLREGNRRDILNILSGEFRGFLAFFTGENCRAMTALEIGRLPPLEISAPRDGAAFPSDDMAEPPAAAYGGFLESFFRRCDELRFNGSEIITGDVLALLGDLRDFLEALYKTGRNKPRREEKAA